MVVNMSDSSLDAVRSELSIDVCNIEVIERGRGCANVFTAEFGGERVIIKMTREDSEKVELYEGFLSQEAAESLGLEVPNVVDSGFHDDVAYTVLEFVPSVDYLSLARSYEFNETIAESLAEVCSQLHKSEVQSVNEDYELLEYIGSARDLLESSDLGSEEYVEILDCIEEYMIGRSTVYTFCHRDLHIPNLRLGPMGNIEAVIDWDHAREANPMYDLALIEARVIDRFAVGSSSEICEQFRDQYGCDIEYEFLYAYKLVQSIRNMAYVSENGAFYPWNELFPSTDDVLKVYRSSIDEYYDKFAEFSE